MNYSLRIEDKLVGSEPIKLRRGALLVELTNAFAQGGSQAVTDEMTKRMDNFVDAFASQLQELKKQL